MALPVISSNMHSLDQLRLAHHASFYRRVQIAEDAQLGFGFSRIQKQAKMQWEKNPKASLY